MLKNTEIPKEKQYPQTVRTEQFGDISKKQTYFFLDQKALEDILSRVYTTSVFAKRAAEPASGAKPSAPISSAKAWVTGAPPTMTLT